MPAARNRRFAILISAVLMQLCLGATYSWSVFVKPLRELTGLPQGTVQFPFTLFYLAFPATMVLSGMVLKRLGPRRSAVFGGVLFGAGWMMASLGHQHFLLVILGIGLLAGIGVGFAYIVPIAVCQQWFPKHQGLVTGTAVAGFGAGAASVSIASGWVMGRFGLTPFQMFGWLGVVFLAVVATAGSFMEFAPGYSTRMQRPLGMKEILRERTFRLLYVAMATGLAAGFAVNANLKELSPEVSLETGILAVALFAAGNAAGRLIWGAIFDRTRGWTAIRLNLLFQVLVLTGGLLVISGRVWFLLFAVMAGFNYGGVLVLYASTVARTWGGERVGEIYGFLFSANIIASPAPVVAGYCMDALGTFVPAILGLALLLVAGAMALGRIDNPPAPRYIGESHH
jgi:OFA family oxalate/formate antiporter-like MFS transporter